MTTASVMAFVFALLCFEAAATAAGIAYENRDQAPLPGIVVGFLLFVAFAVAVAAIVLAEGAKP